MARDVCGGDGEGGRHDSGALGLRPVLVDKRPLEAAPQLFTCPDTGACPAGPVRMEMMGME